MILNPKATTTHHDLPWPTSIQDPQPTLDFREPRPTPDQSPSRNPQTTPTSKQTIEAKHRDVAWAWRCRVMVANDGLMESKERGRNLKERETWETECREWESQRNYLFIYLFYFFTIELQCNSTIPKKITIVAIYNPRCWALWGLKCQIFLTFGICNPQCECSNARHQNC